MPVPNREESEFARHFEHGAYPLLQRRIQAVILRLEKGRLELLHAMQEPGGEAGDSHSVVVSYRITRESPFTQFRVWFGPDEAKAAQFVSELRGLSDELAARGGHEVEILRQVGGFRLRRKSTGT